MGTGRCYILHGAGSLSIVFTPKTSFVVFRFSFLVLARSGPSFSAKRQTRNEKRETRDVLFKLMIQNAILLRQPGLGPLHHKRVKSWLVEN